MKIPNKIPAKYSKYFWDVEFDMLNPSIKTQFVINRLLDKGNVDAVKWVRTHFPEDIIKTTIQKSRDFSMKSAALWSTIFNISHVQVACFQKPYQKTQQKLWPY